MAITPVKMPTIRPPVQQDKFDSPTGYEWADRITSFLKLLTDTLDTLINSPTNPPGLKSPLTTKGDIWGFDTVNNRIPVGTDGQVLTADSTKALGVAYKTPSSFSSPLTTKGDLFTFDTANQRLPVGSDTFILSADSTQSTGLKWIAQSASVGADFMFGAGLDGTVVLDGAATVPWATLAAGVYTMTACAACVNLTLNAGITLVTANYEVYVNQLFTWNGNVNNNGFTPILNAAGSFPFADAIFGSPSNGNTGGAPGAGNAGGTRTDSIGGSGGAGGTGLGTSGAGGVASFANMLGGKSQAANYVMWQQGMFRTAGTSFLLLRGGAGGGGGFGWTGGDKGGGGGSGGGVSGVYARFITGTGGGLFQCNGGNGATGVNPGFQSAGGGGGGGGGLMLCTRTANFASFVTCSATGGIGGTGLGGATNGTAGVNGLVITYVI